MSLFSNRRQLWVFGMALLVGLGGILYGYDIGVISGALLFIHKTIPMTDTQTGLILGAVLGGGLLGTLAAGPLADFLGRRFMILVACMTFIVGVMLILVASTFLMLLSARLFLGVAVGIVAVAVPLYVAELVPARERGKYVAFFQLFLTFGILLAYAVDLYFTPTGDWRAMFSVVLIPACVLLLGMLKLPESPRWLLANGFPEKARQVLRRTHSTDEADAAMDEIVESMQGAGGGWQELLSRPLWLPLFIALGIAILNQWTGINTFLQYAPSILKESGLQSDWVAMLGSTSIAALNFLCTIVALFLVDRVGRRPLLLIGVAGVFVSEVFLGFVNFWHMATLLRGWLSLISLFGFIVSYAIGPGVVVWLAISELFPTRVRGKGIALCLFFNSLAGTLLVTTFLNITHAVGWEGVYWLCASFSGLYFLLVYFYLPETKAQSLEKIQRYFYNHQVGTATQPLYGFDGVEGDLSRSDLPSA